ncbi:MAG: hypothetical protein V2I82_04065 [Halieaceae bacterium]|jgi:hypothetical protein|nr:hypothetical protein [Halieaceae bacterium]
MKKTLKARIPFALAAAAITTSTLATQSMADPSAAHIAHGVVVKRVVAAAVLRESRATGFKWEAKSTLSDPKARLTDASTTKKVTWPETQKAGYLQRNGLTQYKLARHDAPQMMGHVWPEQQSSLKGFKWGLRNTATQSGFKWGLRNTVEQSGFKWGLRNAVEQTGFKWGLR